MEYELSALVRFPDNIIGQTIEELFIEDSESNFNIRFKPLSTEEVIPNALQVSPSEFQRQCEKAEEQRYVRVHYKSFALDDRQAWLLGSRDIESFCSWLTFLCLKPFDIVSWDAVLGGDRNRITASKMPNTPHDKNPLIKMTGYTPPLNINLSKWILTQINPELSHILRWYRKSTLTTFPEEKLIFLVTAMEGVSEALQQEGERLIRCSSCNNEFSLGPSVSKSGLLDFIRNNLGYSRSKLYDPIRKQRSKFVHAASKNLYTPELLIILDAAEALAISAISYYIFSSTEIPFINKEKIAENSYFNYHPVKGELGWIKGRLDKMISF